MMEAPLVTYLVLTSAYSLGNHDDVTSWMTGKICSVSIPIDNHANMVRFTVTIKTTLSIFM